MSHVGMPDGPPSAGLARGRLRVANLSVNINSYLARPAAKSCALDLTLPIGYPLLMWRARASKS